ncbi:hypothetical protein THAOC_30630 [Thalassiosira oceanica]|uniref:Uncharacterized protein n=1 Tax=Thalassiosira oceanica TaxID=159749 RepID=K0RN90_THAOC|nr:hypothetical protein THAOC_30630 [Thalassiosira oceanica]|eukprot:EJK50406.1 hypothetical protein THAOC_30630 [Thalassiosira oceanica]
MGKPTHDDVYDRQIRLWGADAQFRDASMCTATSRTRDDEARGPTGSAMAAAAVARHLSLSSEMSLAAEGARVGGASYYARMMPPW